MANTWNEQDTNKLVELYTAAIEANDGKAIDQKALITIADEVEVTHHAARQKLVSLKQYVKADAARKVGGASATRKIDIVRSIATTTGLTLDSLEKSSKPELEALDKFIKTMLAPEAS